MIVTSREMKRIEDSAAKMNISYARLMENAGSAAASFIRRTINIIGLNCLVFCGKGNNGGDGFVVARKLQEYGAKVIVVLAGDKPQTVEADAMMLQLLKMEIPIYNFAADNAKIMQYMRYVDIVVDAIYGTGFKCPLNKEHKEICRAINDAIAAIFSLDIPSGAEGDTGKADDDAVKADFTIVFDSLKPAHLISPGKMLCGQIEIADIGIPIQAHECITPPYEFTFSSPELVFSLLKPRADDSHKGTHGKLLNIGGALGLGGAVVQSTMAAYASGAGYVTVATTQPVYMATASRMIEATALVLPENSLGTLSYGSADKILSMAKGSTAILLGCGLGTNNDTKLLVNDIIKKSSVPILLDADGINCAATGINIFKERDCGLVLTPHLGEMSRLTGLSADQIASDRVNVIRDFARANNVTLVLKGSVTLIAAPSGNIYINTTGNPGLAKAGSGDVLSGMIASFMAQGLSPEQAAVCGVYLHGLAADRCAKRLSQYAMLPLDILDDLAEIFLQNGR